MFTLYKSTCKDYVHTIMHAILVCFHSSLNSDMDCMIFNVCILSFMHVYTQKGRALRSESARHFLLGKTEVSHVPQAGIEPSTFGCLVR